MTTPFVELKGSLVRHSSSGTQAWQQAPEARSLQSVISPSSIVSVLLCIAVAAALTKKGRPHP